MLDKAPYTIGPNCHTNMFGNQNQFDKPRIKPIGMQLERPMCSGLDDDTKIWSDQEIELHTSSTAVAYASATQTRQKKKLFRKMMTSMQFRNLVLNIQ